MRNPELVSLQSSTYHTSLTLQGIYHTVLNFASDSVGKVDTFGQFATELLVAAHKYQLDCLKSLCEQQLLSQINTESVLDLIIFADMHQAIELNSKCLDYIAKNFNNVTTTEGWKKIVDRDNLLAKLYVQLHLKYSEVMIHNFMNHSLLMYDGYNKKVGSKKKKVKSPKNCTPRPDLDFEKYLLKYSNVINGKEELMDVILLVGDSELKVHKSILSTRSSVFEAMFAHKENRVQITDVDLKVLKVLIKYIYSGKVERLVRYFAELLLAADKYQVAGFKSICEQQLLTKVITTESVSRLLILAHMNQITELTFKCIDYISNNCTEVIASKGWKNIVVKVDLLTKICELLNLNFTEQLFLSPINAESVSDLLILADKHQITELTSKCVDYMTGNGTEVMATTAQN